MAVKSKNWRATCQVTATTPKSFFRGKSFEDAAGMVFSYYLGGGFSPLTAKQEETLKSGGAVKFTALGEVRMAQVEPEEDCGECEPCVYGKYNFPDPDDPRRHCINCTCFMCIPGG